MQVKLSHIVIWALLLIILVLSLVLIFRKPEPVPLDGEAEIEVLEDKNTHLEKLNATLKDQIIRLNNEIDNLSEAKTVIKHIYHDQINIISTADSRQLDSIIRANW